MYVKFFNISGIILSTLGTVFTLYNILSTNTRNVGTYGYLKNLQIDFTKQKNKTINGCLLIVFGSLLQIIAQALTYFVNS